MLFVAFSINLLGGFADVLCFSGNQTVSGEHEAAKPPFLIKDVTVDGGASIVEKNISADGTKVTFKVSFSTPGKATSTVTFKAPNPWPAGIPPEIPPDDVTDEFTIVEVSSINGLDKVPVNVGSCQDTFNYLRERSSPMRQRADLQT